MADDARQHRIDSRLLLLLLLVHLVGSVRYLLMDVFERVAFRRYQPAATAAAVSLAVLVVHDDGMGGHDKVRVVRVAVDEALRLCLDDQEICSATSDAGQSETVPGAEPAAGLDRFLEMGLENRQVVRMAQFLDGTREEGFFAEVGTVGQRDSGDVDGHNFATRVQFGGELLDDGSSGRDDGRRRHFLRRRNPPGDTDEAVLRISSAGAASHRGQGHFQVGSLQTHSGRRRSCCCCSAVSLGLVAAAAWITWIRLEDG